MPNMFGGDQMDEDYNPGWHSEQRRKERLIRENLERNGIDCDDFLSRWNVVMECNGRYSISDIGEINRGKVIIFYEIPNKYRQKTGRISQIRRAIDLREYLKKMKIEYKEVPAAQEVETYLLLRAEELKTLASKVGGKDV